MDFIVKSRIVVNWAAYPSASAVSIATIAYCRVGGVKDIVFLITGYREYT